TIHHGTSTRLVHCAAHGAQSNAWSDRRAVWKRRGAPDLWLVLRTRDDPRSGRLSLWACGPNAHDACVEPVPGCLSTCADTLPYAANVPEELRCTGANAGEGSLRCIRLQLRCELSGAAGRRGSDRP